MCIRDSAYSIYSNVNHCGIRDPETEYENTASRRQVAFSQRAPNDRRPTNFTRLLNQHTIHSTLHQPHTLIQYYLITPRETTLCRIDYRNTKVSFNHQRR